MPRPRPLPMPLGDAFSVRDALAAGVTPRRLRARDLATPFRGTRRRRAAPPSTSWVHAPDSGSATLPGGAAPGRALPWSDPSAESQRRRDDHLADLRLFRTVMADGSFFCGRTAAYAYGLPIAPGERLEVGVFAPRRAPVRQGLRGRKVAPHLARIRVLDGLPFTDPASTWTMLGAELSLRELVVLGDALVRVPRDRRGIPLPEERLATVDELRVAVEAGTRSGRVKLRSALESIREGSSSPLETEYRLDAEAYGMPVPELDVEVRDATRRLIGISEFVYREFRVVVEVEGDHHRVSRRQWDRDIEKYQAYADAGWRVVRLTSSHIRRSTRGVSIVATTLAQRGWTGSLRPPR